MIRLFVSLLVALALVGCPMLGRSPEHETTVQAGDTTLAGTVEWAPRQVQATMSDVASASTVSLISTVSGETVATTVTDGLGRFKLSFPTTFRPDPAVSYYLEAIKGLSSNLPGRNVARVRTIAKFVGGWTTLTNATPEGTLLLNPTTTALAIAGALRGVSDFTTYMGAVSGSTYTPPSGSPVTTTDCTSVLGIVNQSLTGDGDPVAQVTLSGGTWQRTNSGLALALSQLSPTSGTVGTTLQATGSALSMAAQNIVSFNGVAAPAVVSANGTTLSVTVPSGAASGQTTLKVGNVTALGPLFTVLPSITSMTPKAGVAADAPGRTGSLVVLYGEGLGSTGTVTLNGLATTVVSWASRSVTIALPNGATTGTPILTTAGNSATAPALSVVANAAPQSSFDALATGTDPGTHASDGGGSGESVVASSTARSGGNVYRTTSWAGGHGIRLPGIVPTKAVIVAGFWMRTNTVINSWPAVNSIKGHGQVPAYAGIWGTPWLTAMAGPSYPYTWVPGASGQLLVAHTPDAWTYVQATASVDVGQGYQYGPGVRGCADYCGDNGFMFDVDDVVLFESDP